MWQCSVSGGLSDYGLQSGVEIIHKARHSDSKYIAAYLQPSHDPYHHVDGPELSERISYLLHAVLSTGMIAHFMVKNAPDMNNNNSCDHA